MSLAATVIILALIWAIATATFTVPNLVLGAVIAGLALLLLRDHFKTRGRLGKAMRWGALALVFLRELLVSAFNVAIWVLRTDLRASLSPAIVAVPLTVTRDVEITLLANLVTLTPGTLSIDVSEDRKVLYVHALDGRDPEAIRRSIIDVFERRILEVMR
jgi:multisubunit Na+/H+ antiporter MnhE subunit